MFLFRGGRVSRASAIFGTALGIKPRLHVSLEGKLINHGKIRGRKASLLGLVEEMRQYTDIQEHDTIAICHGDCEDEANFVLSEVRRHFGVENAIVNPLAAAIGTMIDIDIQHLQKYYGDKPVLTDVTFTVQAGEHIGLLGANGVGKTTLFRLLSGEEASDGGSFTMSKSAGVLSQIPDVPDGFTAGDVINGAFEPLREMERRLAELEALDGGALTKEYGELVYRYEAAGGYETGLRLARVRQGLQIGDDLYHRRFSLLSGGEKTRVNLARLMLEEPAILLLDEPTNHLDVSSAEWLEGFLSDYKGTALIISHDRFFLDNTVTRVVELEGGVSTVYNGNYSFFAAEKERRYEESLERHEREQREINRLTSVARRMHDYAGKNAKLHRRAFAIEKRAARIPLTERPKKQAELRQKFVSAPLRADDVLHIKDVSKRFGERVILNPTTLSVRPGDRIALLGPNGTGKTTLLNILTGDLAPDGGEVRKGPQVRMAVLPQSVEFPHPERTLYDTMGSIFAGRTSLRRWTSFRAANAAVWRFAC